jgi:hypothetical protein
MELDELKHAWQTLGRQMERQDALQLQLLREYRLEHARRSLRPLFWGQWLQIALGIGLVLLGVACWTRNVETPVLLATGITLHVFGVAHIVFAVATLCLGGSIDYTVPVLRIQKRIALLLCFQRLNGSVCGAPWWVMWVPVVVAFAGIGDARPQGTSPAWMTISLAIGLAGLVATWGAALLSWRRQRRQPSSSPACATWTSSHASSATDAPGRALSAGCSR